MTVHVAPHRWADLWAGKVGDTERTEMEQHARSCSSCAKVRQRVTRASDSFAQIRTQLSPDVPWDAVRARVHWSVSTEKRAALRQPRPAYVWLTGGLVAGTAVALLSGREPQPATPGHDDFALREDHAAVPLPAEPTASGQPAAPLVGLVSRASGDVMVDGVRPADLFEKQLHSGSLIATGDGRVDIQFGDKSAFALGPRSTVELRRFDAQVIELAVDGTVDIAVAPRTSGQRFLVDAGERTVEVHGTQFRVVQDAAGTTVACERGEVAIRDPKGAIAVGAEQKLRVARGAGVAGEHVVALPADEHEALAQSAPLALPLWDPAALVQSSAPLEVATSGRRDVRVDGIELGLAPLRVRVMPGRHTVEAADSAGRFRRAGWVDVAAAPHGTRLEIPAEPPPTSGITERKRQLRAGIDQARLARCTRSIAKAGLTGTYVNIEIQVDAGGAVNLLNVIDTDLPSATASCVRDILRDVRFRPGAPATWREQIDL